MMGTGKRATAAHITGAMTTTMPMAVAPEDPYSTGRSTLYHTFHASRVAVHRVPCTVQRSPCCGARCCAVLSIGDPLIHGERGQDPGTG